MLLRKLTALIPHLSFFSAAFASPSPLFPCGSGQTTQNPTCCKWFDVLEDLQTNLFSSGKCVKSAPRSLRLAFHDAIGYSPSFTSQGKWGGGGADGSIMTFSETESSYGANAGLEDIIEAERPFAIKHGVSFGDVIQFSSAVGLTNCPGSPRLAFLAGRPNATQPAPMGLVPAPSESVTGILARFADVGFGEEEVVALMAAHTIGGQAHIDPTIPGMGFDSTPDKFDSQFYLETLLKGTMWPGNGSHPGESMSPSKNEFRLESDWALARDVRTACEWVSLVNYNTMIQKFTAAMKKLSLLGQNVDDLVDCSDVIPLSVSRPGAQWTEELVTLPDGMKLTDLEIKCKGFTGLSSMIGQSAVPRRDRRTSH
ncbi:class II peroxidase [Jaapia argillacea MUCL 33604]|uniref:Peroxidase n=1 Tax=Jaapia argillacea MUCL 33604 TaxID=933084 RepID=A0A067PZP4_9AGAM|nr:class II peroxidase [Jaapia argillacea MUCL 33604]